MESFTKVNKYEPRKKRQRAIPKPINKNRQEFGEQKKTEIMGTDHIEDLLFGSFAQDIINEEQQPGVEGSDEESAPREQPNPAPNFNAVINKTNDYKSESFAANCAYVAIQHGFDRRIKNKAPFQTESMRVCNDDDISTFIHDTARIFNYVVPKRFNNNHLSYNHCAQHYGSPFRYAACAGVFFRYADQNQENEKEILSLNVNINDIDVNDFASFVKWYSPELLCETENKIDPQIAMSITGTQYLILPNSFR